MEMNFVYKVFKFDGNYVENILYSFVEFPFFLLQNFESICNIVLPEFYINPDGTCISISNCLQVSMDSVLQICLLLALGLQTHQFPADIPDQGSLQLPDLDGGKPKTEIILKPPIPKPLSLIEPVSDVRHARAASNRRHAKNSKKTTTTKMSLFTRRSIIESDNGTSSTVSWMAQVKMSLLNEFT